MSPQSKMESPTCDYENKMETEKGHFKTLALSGQCKNFGHPVFGLDSNRYERCCQVVVDSVENCRQQGNYIAGNQ